MTTGAPARPEGISFAGGGLAMTTGLRPDLQRILLPGPYRMGGAYMTPPLLQRLLSPRGSVNDSPSAPM